MEYTNTTLSILIGTNVFNCVNCSFAYVTADIRRILMQLIIIKQTNQKCSFHDSADSKMATLEKGIMGTGSGKI